MFDLFEKGFNKSENLKVKKQKGFSLSKLLKWFLGCKNFPLMDLSVAFKCLKWLEDRNR